MNPQVKKTRIGLLSAFLCATTIAVADEVAVSGRAILEKHRDAVVTVQFVLKQRLSFPGMNTEETESTSETTGTVIDANGLTVVSLSETDPSGLMETMMQGLGGMQGLQMTTEVRDVKILMTDGTEVPAEVVLRDKVLDMAFVRPRQKSEKPFAFIAMDDPGKPELLDQVITLNRLGTVANRVHSASVERIDAVVERPRTFYIPGKDPTNTNLGSPGFTLDGRFVGVFLMRAVKATGGGAGGPFGRMQDNMVVVLLPAADIQEAAAQAPPLAE